MWMLVPLGPASDASLLMWNMELQVCVEIFGKCDLRHLFSVKPIIDTIIVLHEVNHMFHVFSIIDLTVVTCDLSNYVDVIVVLHNALALNLDLGPRYSPTRCVYILRDFPCGKLWL